MILFLDCLILTTSFVSASENSTDNFQKEDDLHLKNIDKKTFTDLSSEINDLNKTEIRLNNDYYYQDGDNNEGIVIDRSLTIDGQGRHKTINE